MSQTATCTFIKYSFGVVEISKYLVFYDLRCDYYFYIKNVSPASVIIKITLIFLKVFILVYVYLLFGHYLLLAIVE